MVELILLKFINGQTCGVENFEFLNLSVNLSTNVTNCTQSGSTTVNITGVGVSFP